MERLFLISLAWLLICLPGCDPSNAGSFADLMRAASPPDSSVVAAVLDAREEPEPEKPPEPQRQTGAFDAGLDAAAEVLAKAAEEPPPTTAEHLVFLYTTRWCTSCPLAKRLVVPQLISRGYEVREVAIDNWTEEQCDAAKIEAVPAFVFMRRDEPGGTNLTQIRVVTGGLDRFNRFNAAAFATAFADCPPKPAAGGIFSATELPAFRLADWIPLVEGQEKSLAWGVKLSAAKPIVWTVRKSGTSIFLEFKDDAGLTVHVGPRSLTVRHVEINVPGGYVEIKTSALLPALKTIRQTIDLAPGRPSPPRNQLPPETKGKPVA